MLGNYILNISDRIKVICKQLLQNQNMEKKSLLVEMYIKGDEFLH